jgi:NAD(P)-dependent dehydrogenase (short-subunit alcohol dehydrogenase family)
MHTVITGANRGLGLEFSRQCRQLGHSVTALCRQSSEDLEALDVDVMPGVDVRNPPSLEELKPIDRLILNAGIWRDESLENMDFDSIREQFEVNTLGPLRILVKVLDKLGQGSKILVITSRMGCIADNTSGGRYGYRLSKAALNCAAVSLSLDLKPRGISVGIVHPGWVATDMTKHTGSITPKESVEGVLNVMRGLNLENTGSLWDYRQEKLPW